MVTGEDGARFLSPWRSSRWSWHIKWGSGSIRSVWHPVEQGRQSTSMTTATGQLRAGGVVWEFSGEVTELLAHAEDGGEVSSDEGGRRMSVLVGASVPVMAWSIVMDASLPGSCRGDTGQGRVLA